MSLVSFRPEADSVDTPALIIFWLVDDPGKLLDKFFLKAFQMDAPIILIYTSWTYLPIFDKETLFVEKPLLVRDVIWFAGCRSTGELLYRL